MSATARKLLPQEATPPRPTPAKMKLVEPEAVPVASPAPEETWSPKWQTCRTRFDHESWQDEERERESNQHYRPYLRGLDDEMLMLVLGKLYTDIGLGKSPVLRGDADQNERNAAILLQMYYDIVWRGAQLRPNERSAAEDACAYRWKMTVPSKWVSANVAHGLVTEEIQETGFFPDVDEAIMRALLMLSKTRSVGPNDIEFIRHNEVRLRRRFFKGQHFSFHDAKDRAWAEKLCLGSDWALVQASTTFVGTYRPFDQALSFLGDTYTDAWLKGPERFCFASKGDRTYQHRLFDKAAFGFKQYCPDQIRRFKSITKLGKVPLWQKPPDLLDLMEAYEAPEVSEKVEEQAQVVRNDQQLDLLHVLSLPWSGDGEQQFLFGTLPRPRWDGEANEQTLF